MCNSPLSRCPVAAKMQSSLLLKSECVRADHCYESGICRLGKVAARLTSLQLMSKQLYTINLLYNVVTCAHPAAGCLFQGIV